MYCVVKFYQFFRVVLFQIHFRSVVIRIRNDFGVLLKVSGSTGSGFTTPLLSSKVLTASGMMKRWCVCAGARRCVTCCCRTWAPGRSTSSTSSTTSPGRPTTWSASTATPPMRPGVIWSPVRLSYWMAIRIQLQFFRFVRTQSFYPFFFLLKRSM